MGGAPGKEFGDDGDVSHAETFDEHFVGHGDLEFVGEEVPGFFVLFGGIDDDAVPIPNRADLGSTQ
jgi:hypothetical protein